MNIIIKGWPGYGKSHRVATLPQMRWKLGVLRIGSDTKSISHYGDVVTWFHRVKQLSLISIPGVFTQNLGNIVGTWSAHWIVTVSVLVLRLCYSDIALYQQYENNLGYYIISRIRKQSWKVANGLIFWKTKGIMWKGKYLVL